MSKLGLQNIAQLEKPPKTQAIHIGAALLKPQIFENISAAWVRENAYERSLMFAEHCFTALGDARAKMVSYLACITFLLLAILVPSCSTTVSHKVCVALSTLFKIGHRMLQHISAA
jgi:hypothetical protein